MKFLKLLPIVNVLLILGVLSYLISSEINSSDKPDYIYIDNIELFNGFNMSIDLSKIHKKKIKTQAEKIDSLYTIFKSQIDAKKDNSILKVSQQKLQKEDEELTKMKQNFSSEISKQVWNRLNAYIQEYGELKKNKIIFGTQGSGNIMYAEDAVNVTSEVLKYANSKYEGE